MEIEWRDLKSLSPYARNARTHSDEQLAQILASMLEFGWTNPVLVDSTGGIVAGHGRVLAAERAGDQEIPRGEPGRVPCICLGELTDAQKRAYVIADNKIALNAGWDDELLRSELQALDADGFDMALVGFSDKELEKLLQAAEDDPGDTSPQIEGLKYSVIVECADEKHQIQVLNRLESEGLQCRPLMS